MGRLIGIDLGTETSSVAVMVGGVPTVIPNQEGARTTPSVVSLTAQGEWLVGEPARRRASINPESTVFAVKRLMGRRFDAPEIETVRPFLPYQLAAASNGDVVVKIEERAYSPQEISSLILQKLKAAAEEHLGEPVEEAIVTVPAFFGDRQRRATREAALLAGLKVSRVINEPTAAALAYGLKNAKGQFVAVYDLGGGTFDITILEMADGLFQVKATGGNTFLGGEDFDHRIVDWLVSEFRSEFGGDLKQDLVALQRLKEMAEKAKLEISTSRETEIALPYISADSSGPKHLSRVLTRQKYESLTDDLLEQTKEPCRRCLADAGMRPDQIDEVLLVGGQARDPRVAVVVREVFGREARRGINLDESVAIGAAIQTGIISGGVKDLVLLDVIPYGLMIEPRATDSLLVSLIDRNSTIPTRKSRVFTTTTDNGTRIEFHLLDTAGEPAAFERMMKIEVDGIPPGPAGVPSVEVVFDIDVNGILSVSAFDQATGRSLPAAIRSPQGRG
jgi:molecular chaperone DnaK